jgi:hypothetical protein
MGKLIVIALIGACAWAGWVVHTEGREQAFGGILAPIESARDSDSSPAFALSPAAQTTDLPSHSRSRGQSTLQDLRDR